MFPKIPNFRFLYRSEHREILSYPFFAIHDDVKILEHLRNRKYRRHYLFDLMIIAFIVIDTVVCSLIYGVDGPETKDPSVMHQVIFKYMGEFVRLRASMTILPADAQLLLIYFLLYFEQCPHLRYVMITTTKKNYLRLKYRKSVSGTAELDRELIRFHQSLKRNLRKLAIFTELELYACFALPFIVGEVYNSLISNYEYFPGPRIYICLLELLFYFKTIISMVNIGFRFISQIFVIQIKQQWCIKRMNGRNRNDAMLKWMRTGLNLTAEIDAVNALISKYVTITIVIVLLVGLSCMNVVFEDTEKAVFVQLMPFLSFGTVYLVSIFMITNIGSKTIGLNIRIFKRLRQMQTEILSNKRLSYAQVIKLDLVNEYRMLLQKCSFRLWNSNPINNRLFAFQIFTYASVFYLKLKTENSYFGYAK